MRQERLYREVRRAFEDFVVPELRSLRDEMQRSRLDLRAALAEIKAELTAAGLPRD